MPGLIAQRMNRNQAYLMAAAAFTRGLNVFQRCIKRRNMQAAHPTRHLAV